MYINIFLSVPPESSTSSRGKFVIAFTWKEGCGKIQICDRMSQLKKLERRMSKMKLGSEAGALTNERRILSFQMYIKTTYLL